MKSRSFLVAARSVLALTFLIAGGNLEAYAKDITVRWDPNPPGDKVAGYRVYVGTVPGAYTDSFDVGAATSYTYVAANADLMYFFAVVAYNSDGEGPKSSTAVAVGDSLAGVPVRAAHVVQLRASIDAVRLTNGLSKMNWTDPVLVSGATEVRRVHLTEMRTAVGEVYRRVGRPEFTFADGALSGFPVIRGSHIVELRAALSAIQ